MNNQTANPKKLNYTPMIIVMLLGSFVAVLEQTVLGTAVPDLMESFNISTATASWLTTAFLLTNGVMIPLTAYLSERFNTKWLYTTAMAIFSLGTFFALIASSFSTILVGRVLQAIGVGIVMPLMQIVLFTIFKGRAGSAAGLSGLVIGAAPAIGPTLSGYLLTHRINIFGQVFDNSWRAIFAVILPLAVLMTILSAIFISPVIKTSKRRLDVRSLIQSTIGFGALLYGFASVSTNGWLDLKTVILPIVIGLVGIYVFFRHQTEMKRPFLDVSVFESRNFTLGTIIAALLAMAMIGVEMVMPLYMQNVKGLSPFESGLNLLPGALMMMIMAPIAGNLFNKIGPRRLAILGSLLLFVSTVSLLFINEETGIHNVTLLYTLRMFGIAMAMMPLNAFAMSSLQGKRITDGSAATNTVRQVASSLGTALLVSVLQNVTDSSKPASSLINKNAIDYQRGMVNSSINGFHAAFIVAIIFAAIAIMLSTMLPVKKSPATKGAKS